MTEDQKKTSEKFKLNLKNAIHDLTRSVDAIDEHGYAENDHEDAHFFIFESLKDIRKAALLYEEEYDFITLP